jgi:hypothetical protein
MTVSMRSRAKLSRKRVASKKPRNIASLQGRLFHPNKRILRLAWLSYSSSAGLFVLLHSPGAGSRGVTLVRLPDLGRGALRSVATSCRNQEFSSCFVQAPAALAQNRRHVRCLCRIEIQQSCAYGVSHGFSRP